MHSFPAQVRDVGLRWASSAAEGTVTLDLRVAHVQVDNLLSVAPLYAAALRPRPAAGGDPGEPAVVARVVRRLNAGGNGAAPQHAVLYLERFVVRCRPVDVDHTRGAPPIGGARPRATEGGRAAANPGAARGRSRATGRGLRGARPGIETRDHPAGSGANRQEPGQHR